MEDFSFTVNAVDTQEDFKRVKMKIQQVAEGFLNMMSAISIDNRGVDIELIELDGDEADTLEFFGQDEEIFLGSVCWLVKCYASKKEGIRLSMKDKELSHRYYVYADSITGVVEFEGTANHVFGEILLKGDAYYLDPKFHSYVLWSKGLPFDLSMNNLYPSKKGAEKTVFLKKERFRDLRRRKLKDGTLWFYAGQENRSSSLKYDEFSISLEIYEHFKRVVYEGEKFDGDDKRYYNESMKMMIQQRERLRKHPLLVDEVVWSFSHQKKQYVITIVEWLEMLKECEERLFPIMTNKYPLLLRL